MELEILDSIQQIRTTFGDFIMPIITSLGNMGIIWIFLTVVLIVIPKTRKTGIMMGIALVLDLIICDITLKPLVARVRPFDVNTGIQLLITKPHDFSFPSGHTASSFAATFACFFSGQKRIGIPCLILTILIAFSRLYLYVHYPTDVLAGIVIGLICGLAGYLLVSKVCNHTGEGKC